MSGRCNAQVVSITVPRLRYTIDSFEKVGGRDRDRTGDTLLAK
jgi:hypothetical protein